MRSIVSTFPRQIAGSCLVYLGLAVGAGCESSLGRIDRRVDRLLAEQSAALGPEALADLSAQARTSLPPLPYGLDNVTAVFILNPPATRETQRARLE